MLLTRLRGGRALVVPTARVMSWHPPLGAAVLGLAFVAMETPGAGVDYRILVLRMAALALAMGAAFVLDDATEETLAHVPTPLLMRRGMRVGLLLPFVAAAWALLVAVAGPVPADLGGPLPVADVTVEAATLLAVALCASCVGARLTSDRLGGTVAAPVVLVLVGVATLLPADRRLILGSPWDVRWDDSHEWWRALLAIACATFLWLNRAEGPGRGARRLRTRRRAARAF